MEMRARKGLILKDSGWRWVHEKSGGSRLRRRRGDKEAARAASDFQSHPLLTLINTSHFQHKRQRRLSLFSTTLLPDLLLLLRPPTHDQQQPFGHVHHPGDASPHIHSAWQTEYATRHRAYFLTHTCARAVVQEAVREADQPAEDAALSQFPRKFDDANSYGCARCAGPSPPWTNRSVRPSLTSQNTQTRGYG